MLAFSDIPTCLSKTNWLYSHCLFTSTVLILQMSSSASTQSTCPSTRMKVAVRLRPVLKEDDKDKEPCVRGLDGTSLEIWNWRDTRQTIQYSFDVFLDAASRQQDVYERCVKPLMAKALSGQNASIFAYGPTGAGNAIFTYHYNQCCFNILKIVPPTKHTAGFLHSVSQLPHQ